MWRKLIPTSICQPWAIQIYRIWGKGDFTTRTPDPISEYHIRILLYHHIGVVDPSTKACALPGRCFKCLVGNICCDLPRRLIIARYICCWLSSTFSMSRWRSLCGASSLMVSLSVVDWLSTLCEHTISSSINRQVVMVICIHMQFCITRSILVCNIVYIVSKTLTLECYGMLIVPRFYCFVKIAQNSILMGNKCSYDNAFCLCKNLEIGFLVCHTPGLSQTACARPHVAN